MSGATIGGIIGGVVGFFFGAPQLGWMLGSAIGGALDPDVIEGPHIGDGPKQSSAEGVPIPWIVGGVFGPIQGNIIAISQRREVKKKDNGKGGPVSVTYEAHQDFCLLVCESSEIKGSTVVGPQIIKVNGKIVYDTREGKNFGAENAKFLQNHKFYLGNEDQGPDPTLEAIFGVGETPLHRGVFTCVARDINLTQYGDAIPTYEWVMVAAGEQISNITDTLIPPTYPIFVDNQFPLGSPESQYLITNAHRSGTTAIPGPFSTIDEALSAIPYQVYGNGFLFMGYSDTGDSKSFFAPQETIVNDVKIRLYYNETDFDFAFDGLYATTSDVEAIYSLHPDPGTKYADRNGYIFDLSPYPRGPVPPGVTSLVFSDFNGSGISMESWTIIPATVDIERVHIQPTYGYGDPCLLGRPVLLSDDPNFIIDCQGVVSEAGEFVVAPSGTYSILKNEEKFSLPGLGFERITQNYLGPVLAFDDPNNTEEFWEAAAAAAGVPGTYPTDFPANIGSDDSIYVSTVVNGHLQNNPTNVAIAIERICARGGLESSYIDTIDVDQQLLGYAICDTYDGAESLRPLLTGYALFASEYDGKLRFHKHGADVELLIDPNKLIQGDDKSEESERDQPIEYPRSVMLNAIDITQDFSIRPQISSRTTPDVRAIGQETMQLQIVMFPDMQKQISEIYLKRAWARVEGKRKFSLPFSCDSEVYLKIVPGMPFGFDQKRYIAGQISIEDGELVIDEAPRDRQSAYVSVATAIPALPPTPAKSTLSGITLFAALNIPVLRDQDDKIGIYVAACGLLPGWSGCLLQISYDNEESWDTAIESMTQASVIGYLTNGLTEAPSEGDDTTNTIFASVHGQLDSITRQQYLNEKNPCAILYPDGRAEIIQFQNANETSNGQYELTIIARGRLATTPINHQPGSRFVGLDSVYFLELPSSAIGRTILLRPVTLGTTPENNPVYSIQLSPVVSQQEWRPELVQAVLEGDALEISINPRHRLGTDINPIPSVNFTGFRWKITSGIQTQTADTGPSNTVKTFDVTGWSSPISVSVSQLNRLTGPGPALEFTV